MIPAVDNQIAAQVDCRAGIGASRHVRRQVAAIIEAGFEICRERGARAPKLTDVIWTLLREAAWVTRASPDLERRWQQDLRAVWPQMPVSEQDVLAVRYERQRAGAALLADPNRLGPTPAQISRAEVVMTWWQVVTPPSRCPLERRAYVQAIHALALGVRAAVLAKRLGVGRCTIYRWRDQAMDQIASFIQRFKHV